MTQEEKRLKIFDLIANDDNIIDVKTVAELYTGSLAHLFEHSKVFERVKKAISEDDWISLWNGITISFLSSLYATASIDEKQLDERLKILHDANSDIMIGFGVREREDETGEA